MLTAFAPPAMRYPPIETINTVNQVGEPAAYMGAIVVTSNNEIMRGLVSVRRSCDSDGPVGGSFSA